ncbi:sec7 domain belongs to guanine nucleotide exchange factors [Laccaria bicolor S238N-H82]|uniref:Sec7 domain belongs to guanine nucleotide exchange factors n=1 Tax=Laccaria bicolor (strain S238N-H82 / ATCC MYA-4686) TaxID=486041 RepID=B0CQL6_LACBS|nr:sec7 domain belongs to guanine nucleotide exchange factors [Laccaria bicolor S238N-H82]EDR15667.1 sec7 domain belongs to guanine nucleotide exchange factors [Laccaria bicolor S238N-H82]|eukprot:XP_001873875.1 sec7 domain belongs to guanine nucleotide exchange factors [Laccaria bicolor S238N-H82]
MGDQTSSAFDYKSPDSVPPPPYPNHLDSPLILAETKTTRTKVVTTTTETTTHLLSLPVWKKRGVVDFQPDAYQQRSGLSSQFSSAASFKINKALPPTPPIEKDDSVVLADPVSSFFVAQPSTIVHPSHSTAALAHAALGIGLPHVIPLASTSRLSSEVNSIVFAASPPQSNVRLSPSVRRVKSSQRIGAKGSAGTLASSDSSPIINERRRSRGLSFSAVSFLSFTSSDGKGKEKEKEGVTQDPLHTPPKSLSRRSSFWTRKKILPLTNLPTSPTPREAASPVLPSVSHQYPHCSSLELNNHLPKSSTPPPEHPTAVHHQRRLSRSRSQKIGLYDDLPLSSHASSSQSANVSHDTQTFQRSSTSAPPTQPTHSQNKYSKAASLAGSSDHPQFPRRPGQLPRQRAHTNPPLLHRLSLGVFSNQESSPLSTTACSHSPSVFDSKLKLPGKIPKPLGENESPELYLLRLRSVVSKAEMAAILASSADSFHVQTLRAYIKQFEFHNDPLDVALRKLLMEVGLPRETQQIDRVIEAFAARYLECNPSLFVSEDHPYVLAFSLIMLHTDAFNRSNKRKMNKADYVKNTRLLGVPPEVLECFYDNIVFAPFIFIEDPLDVNSQRCLSSETQSKNSSPPKPLASSSNVPTPLLSRGSKIDPYFLITKGLLDPLRVNVEAYVPNQSPYSCEGTGGPWDEEELQRAFLMADVVEVNSADITRTSFFNIGGAGGSFNSVSNGVSAQADLPPSAPQSLALRVTKVGLLNRKDDVLAGGRKASNRKWKSWSVLLTGSQLLFFRDTTWATALSSQDSPPDGRIAYPEAAPFRPDEILSVKDAVAVHDELYMKYENTLRFVLSDGRQILLQASNELERNEWITRINYASAFKSAGVRMRPLRMSGRDVELTGVAAATSHLHDLHLQNSSLVPELYTWDKSAPRELMDMLSGDEAPTTKQPTMKRRIALMYGDHVDLDPCIDPELVGTEQFIATFQNVKADLSVGYPISLEEGTTFSNQHCSVNSPEPHASAKSNPRLPTRSDVIQFKIQELESRISASQSQLDSDMRCIRNIAILTPFQSATRAKLLVTVQGMAKRITQLRMSLAQLVCHHAVLSNDLVAENRSLSHSRELALHAARKTLQRQQSKDIPQMTLSLHDQYPLLRLPSSESLENSASRRPESSVCDSFHSAIDFGPDWPSSEELLSSNFLDTPRVFGSPKPPPSSSSFYSQSAPSSFSHGQPALCERSSSFDTNETQVDDGQTSFYITREDNEEAEAWNETRCAKRVSLVQVPSNIHISREYDRRAQMSSLCRH